MSEGILYSTKLNFCSFFNVRGTWWQHTRLIKPTFTEFGQLTIKQIIKIILSSLPWVKLYLSNGIKVIMSKPKPKNWRKSCVRPWLPEKCSSISVAYSNFKISVLIIFDRGHYLSFIFFKQHPRHLLCVLWGLVLIYWFSYFTLSKVVFCM